MTLTSEMESEDSCLDFPWQKGVFDAHCHPTDTLSSLSSIPSMRAKVLTIMATRAQDQTLVAQAADKHGFSKEEAPDSDVDCWSHRQKVIPAFGWHPWFSHQMFDESEYNGATTLSDEQKIAHYQSVLTPRSDNREFLGCLPHPRPFGHFLSQTRSYLERYPQALVGEIGLDRSFRIPEAWLPEQVEDRNDALTPGGREGRKLSPYRVNIEHQKKVLMAQLRLSGELRRAVSVHGVQAHGVLYDTLAQTWKGHEKHVPSKRERRRRGTADLLETEDLEVSSAVPRPYPPRICLHSFSGPAETVKQYFARSVPCEVFFSFSTTINAWSEDGHGKVENAVRAVPDDRVLIESDLHTAGDKIDLYLEQIARKICVVKQWELHDGVERLGRNWRRFVFGT